MLWKNLNNKCIGIWGMGKEGQSAKATLLKHSAPQKIIEISEENISDIFKCDIVIKSPGVSLYRDEILQAQKNGIIITSGTNLFFSNKNPKTKIIAITGTKGKSTTSSLLAHTLKHLGTNTLLAGNIGVPLVDLVDMEADYIVAELSSYQCADLIGTPDIGVLVNLYPEHLPWHTSHDRYYRDKLNMLVQSDIQILNAEDARTQSFTQKDEPFKQAKYFNDEVHSDNNWFYDGDKKLFPCSVLNLPGQHNQKNACAVLTVIKELGFSLTDCAEAFKTFCALPHRLQIIKEHNGIIFVDDSISTTPETALAALKAFESVSNISLIIGGQNRGQDFIELISYIKNHPHIHLITMPDTGKIAEETARQQGVSFWPADTMETAVRTAIHLTKPTGVILLSPAAPSYNKYRNFEERGSDFAAHVNNFTLTTHNEE
ncbi:MAG: UDP-N-acetylmuramoyl-L-alanine--D-glutamate ligase [Alphaproteobacteria bacterium]|nr:UDP-N-acetylmuramoyl-L-alanine--D-glutamate ligase [Alphaproteobacteria bacterium]